MPTSWPTDDAKPLTIDELCPSVDLASYYHFAKAVHHRYRLPGHHLLLVEKGALTFGDSGQRQTASNRMLICFKPRPVNDFFVSPGSTFFNFHSYLTGRLDDHRPLTSASVVVPTLVDTGDAFGEFRRLFTTICVALDKRGAAQQLRLRAAVLEVLALFLECGTATGSEPATMEPWSLMESRLRLNLDQTPNIAELAASMGYSVDHFIRAFRQRFGSTPKAYHTRLRILEAARRLKHSDAAVKTISFALGFHDPRTFRRQFRQHVGLSPSAYRQHDHDDKAAAPPLGESLLAMNQQITAADAPPDIDSRFRLR